MPSGYIGLYDPPPSSPNLTKTRGGSYKGRDSRPPKCLPAAPVLPLGILLFYPKNRSPFCVRSCQYLNFSVSHQDLKKPGSQLFYKISLLFQKQDLNSVSHAQPVSQASISRERQYLTGLSISRPVSQGL